MKILHTSDWHGDWSSHGVARFAEIERAAHETVQTAIDERVDLYAFTGDLSNPDSGAAIFPAIELAMHCATELSAAGIASVWMAGNHDVIEDGSGNTTLTPMRPLQRCSGRPNYQPLKGRIVIIESPTYMSLEIGKETLRLLAFPFTASSRPYNPETFIYDCIPDEDWEAGIVTLSHLGVPGVQPGEETKEMPRGRDVLFPFEATKHARARLQGHYHRRQMFDPRDGGPPILIPGSLARLTFSEEKHEPGFYIVEV